MDFEPIPAGLNPRGQKGKLRRSARELERQAEGLERRAHGLRFEAFRRRAAAAKPC